MFGQKKLLQKQLDDYAVQVNKLEREVSELKKENRICLAAKEQLLQQVIKYKAICREISPKRSSAFSASTNHKDAILQMNTHFPCDFCCLVDVDLDILNLFLEKVSQLKCGIYIPSKQSIAFCDDFFDFKKRLSRRETVPMLYTLLDIKVTSRRFESFNAELGSDELIVILETLFSYIEAQGE